MQDVTNLLIQKIGGSLTEGSLCDGAGAAGIKEGRGEHRQLPLEQIQKSEVVVVWGRDVSVTNRHLMPFIKDKILITIDPFKSDIAKMSHLHLQLAPRSDFFLALLLSRFVIMEEMHDKEWLAQHASDWDDYYDFIRTFRIKSLLALMDLSLAKIGDMLSLIKGKKTVFLVGTGVQRYTNGAYVLRAIDSLAALLGLFGREGCGVSYMGESRLGFDDPFKIKCNRVSKALTPFGEFETVLIQGGNPATSMPESTRVIDELEKVKNLIYFGLYENKTSKMARIVIPAKNFFEKEDVRLSYGSKYALKMNKIEDAFFGISEYAFVSKMFEFLGFEGLLSEQEYIDYWLKQCKEEEDALVSPAFETIPYECGFENGFVFLDDYDDEFLDHKKLKRYKKREDENNDEYWLINRKSKSSLNTQFQKNNKVILHPKSGFKEDESVFLQSQQGIIELVVRLSQDARQDCAIVHPNTLHINKLTAPLESLEGKNACYSEVKVKIFRV
jgi:anaerobic selenocysteine-containing dehydrogenase